jgi:predicted dithiol-disulfide oxidoreductase (DUF899 family)
MIHAQIVSPDEWRDAQKKHLEHQKASTRALDALRAARRELPMVRVDDATSFTFGSTTSDLTLLDLFAGHKQLILYHFMLGSDDKEGCVGCSLFADHIPDLSHLTSRDTSFACVAPAPVEKIEAFKKRMGWEFPFYSSQETFKSVEGKDVTWLPGNGYFGISVFLREGDEVFHTYSTTDRGVDIFLVTYHLLDMTPLGRQEVGNGMMNFRLHDQYPASV